VTDESLGLPNLVVVLPGHEVAPPWIEHVGDDPDLPCHAVGADDDLAGAHLRLGPTRERSPDIAAAEQAEHDVGPGRQARQVDPLVGSGPAHRHVDRIDAGEFVEQPLALTH
jgi:hypothetical protein